MFNVILVLKCLPHETETLLDGADDDLNNLREHATVVYDDRAPDEDAGCWYGTNHARGAVVAVWPDLWIGISCWPEEDDVLSGYFAGFLVEKGKKAVRVMGVNGVNSIHYGLNGVVNGIDDGIDGVGDTNGLKKDHHGLQLPGYEPDRKIYVVNEVGRYVCT